MYPCKEECQWKTPYLEKSGIRKIHLCTIQLLQQKAISMKKNLLFYILAESRGEDVRKVLNEFFMNQLMMPQDLIDSLVIENTYRMGKVNSRRSRLIIACFGSIQDKIKILRHTKNMDSSQKYSVVEQLPPELNERK